MAALIRIDGLPGADGDYPLDVTYFTNRELHQLKQHAGVRAGELEEAFNAQDNDLVVALCLIALHRAGRKDVPIDALWEARTGVIMLVGDDAEGEDDAVPPVLAPSEPVSPGNENAKPSSSGLGSNGGGDPPVSPLSLTGSRGSDTTVISDPPTSGI